MAREWLRGRFAHLEISEASSGKNLEELDLPRKMSRLAQWCADATNAQAEGPSPTSYRFVYVDQESFEQHTPETFAALAAAFTEYQP